MSPEDRQRFENSYMADPNSGCWIWAGQEKKGYGYFWLPAHPSERKKVAAHRVSYQSFRGVIPDGYQIDHLCKNTFCVNPLHLEAVTQQENIARQRHIHRGKTHCPKGHEYTEANTRLYTRKSKPNVVERHCIACRKDRKKA